MNNCKFLAEIPILSIILASELRIQVTEWWPAAMYAPV